jgi:hypothetical protein
MIENDLKVLRFSSTNLAVVNLEVTIQQMLDAGSIQRLFDCPSRSALRGGFRSQQAQKQSNGQ